MPKPVLVLVALAALSAPVLAADDPIAVRQALMDSNGASAAVAGAIMKGELDYSPVVGKAVITSLAATASAFGDFFPEGSLDPKLSHASPKIWEDAAGFEAQLGKFRTATGEALKASGKTGPADADAFKAAMGPVFDTCKSCHEAFRIEN